MSIYKLMEEDWETYCLMAGIAIIEEFSKPRKNLQIKGGKELQFYGGVGIDVVLDYLNDFYKKGILKKERKGKYYLWSVKDADKCRHILSEG